MSQDPAAPKVVSRLKTGLLVGAPSDNGKTVGGSAPNFLATHDEALFVSNGNNDSIEKIDLVQNRGSPPSGASFPRRWWRRSAASAHRAWLCLPMESGSTSPRWASTPLPCYTRRRSKVLGHIPTAWYPYRVAISPDGQKLVCICFRGFGNGPSAGQEIPKSDFLGLRGVVSVLDLPSDSELKTMTANVLAYNGIVDRSADRKKMSSPVIPNQPGKVSKEIKYVVFITKENHTFDTIFDRVPGAKHDPSLVALGTASNDRAARGSQLWKMSASW